MPRKSKAEKEALARTPAAPPAIGGNVTAETAKKYYGIISQLEAKLAGVRQELKTAWDTAEADGISRKPFKAAMKQLKDDPAAADAWMRQFQQYTTQLGLFDRIDAWKQSETNEEKGRAAA